MAVASIPVDLFNPGQVFACLGFLEAADVLLGDAEGAFDWSDESDVRFMVRASGDESPTSVVLKFFAGARVSSLAPAGSFNDTRKWRVATDTIGVDEPFPFPDPSSPATLPALLEGPAPAPSERDRLVIDYWGDATRRDNVKFWGGSAGYPGAALARDAIELVRDQCADAVTDPFKLSAEQTSSFRLDWRRDYIPIDAGFSLNSHVGRIAAVGYPLVEILAAIGLTHARPARLNVLEYRFSVLGTRDGESHVGSSSTFFDPSLVRAALGAADLGLQGGIQRTFRMYLGWPAKEGQARSITTVSEERTR